VLKAGIAVADRAAEREQQEILTRLRRVEGQIRGIQRMIEEGRQCEAIAAQLLAARAALDKASLHIMAHHIEMCLRGETDEPDSARLDRIIAFFLRFAGSGAVVEALADPDAEQEPI
jgi:DNA-binding FrmR family transcriptional regulator